MDILLIRHGESYHSSLENYNPEKCCPDPLLTDNGRRQAEQLAKKLVGKGIDAIYCSDLLRAVETANIINSYVKCSVFIDSALREINMEIFICLHGIVSRITMNGTHKDDMRYPGGMGQDVWERCSVSLNNIIRSNAYVSQL